MPRAPAAARPCAPSSVAYNRKIEIGTQLSTIGEAVEAEGSSILVPALSLAMLDETRELVFLSLLGEGSEHLRRLRVSMNTVAGCVFQSGKAIITHDPRRSSTADVALASSSSLTSAATGNSTLATCGRWSAWAARGSCITRS